MPKPEQPVLVQQNIRLPNGVFQAVKYLAEAQKTTVPKLLESELAKYARDQLKLIGREAIVNTITNQFADDLAFWHELFDGLETEPSEV